MTDDDLAKAIKGLKDGAHKVEVRPLSYAPTVASTVRAAAEGARHRAARDAAGDREVHIVVDGEVTQKYGANISQVDALLKAGATEVDETE